MRCNRSDLQLKSKGFTIIEVIVAVALFAIIAVPTVGLMTMAARKTNQRIGFADAYELKRRIVNEIKLSGSAFDWNLQTQPIALYASRDLETVGFSDDGTLGDADKYYRIDVLDPVDYVHQASEPYRPFVLSIIWPAFVEATPGNFVNNEANDSNLEKIVLTSVLRK